MGGTRDDTPKSHTRGSVKTFKIWRYHDDNGKSFGDATAHFLRIFLLKIGMDAVLVLENDILIWDVMNHLLLPLPHFCEFRVVYKVDQLLLILMKATGKFG